MHAYANGINSKSNSGNSILAHLVSGARAERCPCGKDRMLNDRHPCRPFWNRCPFHPGLVHSAIRPTKIALQYELCRCNTQAAGQKQHLTHLSLRTPLARNLAHGQQA